ncbi:MAG: hypothetical protein EOS22_06270 [Mesorhizobium sp.]|uniref:hypothetical protein n=1 Tax=Mesorhizobium sp. TaxID=1871066 RepID=UPI000FEAA532|nr:hypothetical protein [Mesorhizobium sp.]RWD30849.1 MAG: hypothetical protein EOS22_06270 [Mesorhizobium sp.]
MKREMLFDLVAEKRAMIDKSIRKNEASRSPEKDAKGQSEKNHKGGNNEGVSSANPRVLSRKEDGDATFPISRKQ